MQWLLILFFTFIISGCQGLQNVDTPESNQTENTPLISISAIELEQNCPISYQQQEGFFIATGHQNGLSIDTNADNNPFNTRSVNNTFVIDSPIHRLICGT